MAREAWVRCQHLWYMQPLCGEEAAVEMVVVDGMMPCQSSVLNLCLMPLGPWPFSIHRLVSHKEFAGILNTHARFRLCMVATAMWREKLNIANRKIHAKEVM